ncbi:MAG TPA: ACT domain-containing protein [Candidatus Brocadiia bacterium]|nr:ACT domain-containing protein [Candidatus Brocadiia bacterium]
MQIATQLGIFLENRPGTLAKVCNELAKAKINILAMSVSDTVDHAVIRLVVDETAKAMHILGERGLIVIEREVIIANIPNKPGILGKVADVLSRAKVNIEYAYCTADSALNTGTLILRVSNARKGLSALKKMKQL